jgi:hypothetical protein
VRFAGAMSAVMQLRVLFIALGRMAQTAIEKLVQEAQQFHLAVNFHGTVFLEDYFPFFEDGFSVV